MTRAALLTVFIGLLCAGSLTGPARGDFPTHPVRVIVGFPAGSAADITARVVGQRIGQLLGQQVVIENKS